MSKQRWKDTLPVVDAPTLVDAADSIALALVVRSRGLAGKRYAARAAAHIRAYRKTLDVKTHRCDWSASSAPHADEELLWRALNAVTWAAGVQCRQQTDHGAVAAMWCRWAEADLRELWKRGQA